MEVARSIKFCAILAVPVLAFVAVVLLLPATSGYSGLLFADVEINLSVADVDTGQPVPGAKLVMHIDDGHNPPDDVIIPIDGEGRGRLLRKGCTCEDHVRGGVLLKTTIDFNWSENIQLDADGYEQLFTHLRAARLVSQVYSTEEHRFQVIFEPFRLRKTLGPRPQNQRAQPAPS